MLQELLDNLISNSNNIKLGLENIHKAAEVLNLKKPAPYVITIAGTNGKGSTITLLERLLVALGYNTGCYTSPHLITFNERIRVNQINVTDQELIEIFNYISVKLQQNKIYLTFFEFITVSAWQIFSNKNLDVLLLEIGLGGRLDAVNAIPKDLAIITSVDFDHQEYLGNDLETIGFEKAGIISENSQVIYGDSFMPDIIAKVARSRNTKLYKFERDYNISEVKTHFIFQNGWEINLQKNPRNTIKLNNIATSLKALDIYLSHLGYLAQEGIGFVSKLNIINSVLKNFEVTGRCSWLNNNKILLDVAHNPQAIKNLSDYITKIDTDFKPVITAVFGMLRDKDIDECLRIISPQINNWYLCGTEIDHIDSKVNKRGTSAHELSEILLKVNPQAVYSCFNNISSCCEQAYNFIEQNNTQNDDNNSILIVFGSFHIVGPAYEYYTRD